MSKSWYVVHAYSGYEKKVMHALQERISLAGMGDYFDEVLVPTEEVVEIKGGRLTGQGRPYLDVLDCGLGVDKATADKIFEPFFTTETKGTGLGLYIANELCKNNHAHLSYHRATTGGSCFRLSFADPRRRRTNS